MCVEGQRVEWVYQHLERKTKGACSHSFPGNSLGSTDRAVSLLSLQHHDWERENVQGEKP